jgi:hypothetical protein
MDNKVNIIIEKIAAKINSGMKDEYPVIQVGVSPGATIQILSKSIFSSIEQV